LEGCGGSAVIESTADWNVVTDNLSVGSGAATDGASFIISGANSVDDNNTVLDVP
jgi:hypothetical protein